VARLTVEIRTPTSADGRYLIEHLRAADRDEMLATLGDADPYAAIDWILGASSHAWAAVSNDTLLMVGGLVPISTLLGGSAAQPWMMGTTHLEARKGALMKVAVRYLGVMRGHYDHLTNYVDARNTTSIRWLKRLGFTVHPQTEPFGPYRMPFHHFEMTS